jgi:thiol-disulfide isomerase/thioredoxin
MLFGTKIAIRALTVLLILCGAALLVLSLRPARIERIAQAPAPPAEGPNLAATSQNLGQFTALPAPLPAPALAFTTRDGAPKQLADFKGKVVLVNLWATWCVPCVEEMPALDRLHVQLGDKLTILAISEDRQGETVVAPFLAKHGIQHLAIFLDPKTAATNEFSAEGLPSSYLIAGDGTIVGKEEGGAQWDDPAMIAKLQPYLNAN